MNTNKIPTPVKQILMHMKPHLDEMVAYVLLRLYGKELFPGIENASVRFLEQGISGTDAQFDPQGILPIGVGGNVRFDEHRSGSDERLPGECATTLVAKYLGIENNPELKRLLSEVLEGDAFGRASRTQLSELIKVAYRYNKSDSYLVLNWVIKVIKVIIHQEQFHFVPVTGEKTLKDVWKLMRTNEPFNGQGNDAVLQSMSSDIGRAMSQPDKVTELASVLKALYRYPYKEEDVFGMIEFPLTGLYNDQVDFRAEVAKMKRDPKDGGGQKLDIKAFVGGRPCNLRLTVFKSDGFHAHKAAFHLGEDVVLIRRSSGNFQIFVDTVRNKISVADVVRMLRWLELSPDKKKTVKWPDLAAGGVHPDAPSIYYQTNAQLIFNGSLTTKAEPSKLATQAIVQALQHGFERNLVRLWCNQRDIRMDGRIEDQLTEADAAHLTMA